jgi:ribosome-binding factor A
MSQKEDKIREILRELAAAYFSRESNRTSLITITDVELLSRGGRANILMTVIPEDQEAAAIDFAHRQLSGFKEYVQENSRIARIPFFEVRIDKGEKNRQRLDEIAKKL